MELSEADGRDIAGKGGRGGGEVLINVPVNIDDGWWFDINALALFTVIVHSGDQL